jgi:hypothetical protein
MEVLSLIRAKFNSQFGTMPTIYDNQVKRITGSGVWCRLTILTGENNRITNGGTTNYARMAGVMTAQLFYQVGRGDGAITDKAKEIINNFSSYRDGGLRFGIGTIERVGLVEDNRTYQINVNIPFTYDNIIGDIQ